MQENKKEVVEQINELQVVEPKMQPQELSIWNSTDVFNTTYKMAGILAQASMIPQAYKGKVGDCIIAIDVANRLGLSPMVVMANSQCVQGNFSWKGSACKAMIDSCGRYKKTRYVEVGERGKDTWGFYLEAITKDDEIIKGVAVDLQMAKDEGWYSRNPKWKSMTELMLKYRASAFFMRTECASVSMGFMLAEENEDIYGNEEQKSNTLTELLDNEIKEDK